MTDIKGRESAIKKALLDWYDRHKRVLSFRGTTDPYAIWVSEIMLQQTTTATVGPYFERFMALFPTVKQLAEADQETVLKAWQGLGYYSRARNLHKAAGIVMDQYDGRFPDTWDGALALPGVGPYTAAAVLSIAYNKPYPAMDGNLTRVTARLINEEEDVGAPSVKRRLFETAQGLMPKARPGDMNQALMDLGATICTPGTPDCAACPLSSYCLAYRDGDPAMLPVMAKKRPPKPVDMAVVIATCGDKALLFTRKEALLHGMTVFWLFEDMTEAQLGEAITEAMRDGGEQFAGQSPRHAEAPLPLTRIGQAKHVFTHRVWHMTLWHLTADKPFTVPGGFWYDRKDIHQLPFPTAMKAAVEGLAALILS